MANPYKNRSANKTFGNLLNNNQSASDYIRNKSEKQMYQKMNKCNFISNGLTQSQFISLNNISAKCNSRYYSYNKANLSMNLVNKLNLANMCVIKTKDNECPASIYLDAVPYTYYIIDPSGYLFGNTVCGIDGYTNYLQCNR